MTTYMYILYYMFLFINDWLHAVYKEEEEEIEIEIEIGLPTDVKHVTHIGWDECAGATNYPIIKGGRNNWDTLDFLKNNNDRHPRLQLLSKFNDYRHHQLPADPSSSAALSNLMVQLEGPPSTDRQDVKPVSLGHHLIADQVSEESIREHQQPWCMLGWILSGSYVLCSFVVVLCDHVGQVIFLKLHVWYPFEYVDPWYALNRDMVHGVDWKDSNFENVSPNSKFNLIRRTL